MKDPIPLHISAFGPRARALTAELNAHWLQGVGPVGPAKASVSAMRQAWRLAGIDPDARIATAFLSGCVLQEGEPFDSPRAKAQAGPGVTMVLHDLVEAEQFGSHMGGKGPPPGLVPLLERYRAIYESYQPADARYLENHRGHLMFLRPEEHEICTADLIRAASFTETKPRLQERIRELGSAGYNHFAIHIRHGHPAMLEDWAEVFSGV